MLYHARKKAGKSSRTIYGIVTDAYKWCFVLLDVFGRVRSPIHLSIPSFPRESYSNLKYRSRFKRSNGSMGMKVILFLF